MSAQYDFPTVEIFGAEEIQGLFNAIYAIAAPMMPLVMIILAITFVGVFAGVIRNAFSFSSMRRRRGDDE